MVVQVQNVNCKKGLINQNRSDFERIFFENVLNIFNKAASNIDISNQTCEGAVKGTAKTGSEHGYCLKIACLEMNA